MFYRNKTKDDKSMAVKITVEYFYENIVEIWLISLAMEQL